MSAPRKPPLRWCRHCPAQVRWGMSVCARCRARGHAVSPPPRGETSWMGDAACLQVDPDLMFSESLSVQATVAAVLCGPCPVRAECLADALATSCAWGVRGGTTERQRWALIAARGEVAA